MQCTTNLSFGESQLPSDFCLPSYSDVLAEMEFLLQFQTLMVRIHHAVLVFGPGFACNEHGMKYIIMYYSSDFTKLLFMFFVIIDCFLKCRAYNVEYLIQ